MKRIIRSLSAMHEFTFFLMKSGIVISSLFLFCTIVIRLRAGPLSVDTYLLHQYAKLMFQLSFVVLLETVLGTVLVEEQLRFRK